MANRLMLLLRITDIITNISMTDTLHLYECINIRGVVCWLTNPGHVIVNPVKHLTRDLHLLNHVNII